MNDIHSLDFLHKRIIKIKYKMLLYNNEHRQSIKYYHYYVLAYTTYLLYHLYSYVDYQYINWNDVCMRDFLSMIHHDNVDKIYSNIMNVVAWNTLALYLNPGFQIHHWNIVFYNIAQLICLYTFKDCQVFVKLFGFYHMLNIYDYLFNIQFYIPNVLTKCTFTLFIYVKEFIHAFYIYLVFKEHIYLDNIYWNKLLEREERHEYIILQTVFYVSYLYYGLCVLHIFFPNFLSKKYKYQ